MQYEGLRESPNTCGYQPYIAQSFSQWRTRPLNQSAIFFFSPSTLTVCEISLSECENLAWCHLSWWLMRSDKASWDIWHTLSSLKAWNNPHIHAYPQWLVEPLLQILLLRGKLELFEHCYTVWARKESITCFCMRSERAEILPWKCLYFCKCSLFF